MLAGHHADLTESFDDDVVEVLLVELEETVDRPGSTTSTGKSVFVHFVLPNYKCS